MKNENYIYSHMQKFLMVLGLVMLCITPTPVYGSDIDISSFGNVDQIKQEKLDFRMKVDFDTKM